MQTASGEPRGDPFACSPMILCRVLKYTQCVTIVNWAVQDGYKRNYWEVQAVVLNRGRFDEAMHYSTLVRPSGAEVGFFVIFVSGAQPRSRKSQLQKEGAEC